MIDFEYFVAWPDICILPCLYLCPTPTHYLSLSPSLLSIKCRTPLIVICMPNWMLLGVTTRGSCHNGLRVPLEVHSIRVSMCISEDASLPSVYRLIVYEYIERQRYIIHAIIRFTKACDCNKDEHDRQSASWLWNPRNHCCVSMVPRFLQTCTEVSAGL
jgi:hypothetical protein